MGSFNWDDAIGLIGAAVGGYYGGPTGAAAGYNAGRYGTQAVEGDDYDELPYILGDSALLYTGYGGEGDTQKIFGGEGATHNSENDSGSGWGNELGKGLTAYGDYSGDSWDGSGNQTQSGSTGMIGGAGGGGTFETGLGSAKEGEGTQWGSILPMLGSLAGNGSSSSGDNYNQRFANIGIGGDSLFGGMLGGGGGGSSTSSLEGGTTSGGSTTTGDTGDAQSSWLGLLGDAFGAVIPALATAYGESTKADLAESKLNEEIKRANLNKLLELQLEALKAKYLQPANATPYWAPGQLGLPTRITAKQNATNANLNQINSLINAYQNAINSR